MIDKDLMKQINELDKGTPIFLVEEMAELTQALMKKERGKQNENNIIEECADVYATLIPYCEYYGITEEDLKAKAEYKIRRAIRRGGN